MVYVNLLYVNNVYWQIRINRMNLTTIYPFSPANLVYIYDPSTPVVSEHVAYYPNYTGHSNEMSNIAVFFINLETFIPCYAGRRLPPICHLFGYEEDNLQGGKPYIAAASSDFNIFQSSSHVETFGFGVLGCETFNDCVFSREVTILCLLPRNCYN